jgi:hypothetical protein
MYLAYKHRNNISTLSLKVFFLDIDEKEGKAVENELQLTYGENHVTFIKCDVMNETEFQSNSIILLYDNEHLANSRHERLRNKTQYSKRYFDCIETESKYPLGYCVLVFFTVEFTRCLFSTYIFKIV